MEQILDKTKIETKLTKLLEIDIPVFQSPMTGYVTPQLVASISNSGGLGILPAGNVSADQLADLIEEVKSLTGKPFGINFLIAPPEPISRKIDEVNKLLNSIRREVGLEEKEISTSLPPNDLERKFEIAIEAGIKIFTFAMGDPTPYLSRLKNNNIIVIPMVTTCAEAVKVANAGADAVIVQGAEAGGHRSTFDSTKGLPLIGTMALVPQVVDAVDIPVIAAGGIMDGRGLTAALALGASAVQMGTRLLLAKECGSNNAYRERIKKATEEDTIITKVFTGKPARALSNKYTELHRENDEIHLNYPYQALATKDIFVKSMQENKADFMPLFAGQGLRLAKEELFASEILEKIEREAYDTAQRLNLFFN